MKKIILSSVSLMAVLVAAPQVSADGASHKKQHHGVHRHHAKHHHHSHHSEVEALRTQVQELLSRINNIEAREKAIPDNIVTSGVKDVSVKISGQVNRAAQGISDGSRRRVRHVENSADPTLFKVEATAKVNQELSAAARLEVGLNTNRTDSVNIQTGADSTQVDPRKAEVIFTSKTYGALSAGKGEPASYALGKHTDLSGTTVAFVSSAYHYGAGGVYFYDNNLPSGTADAAYRQSGNNGNGLRVSDVVGGDGLYGSRTNRVRYDTPTFWGWTFAASHDGKSNDNFDYAARWSQQFTHFKVNVGASAAHIHTTTTNTIAVSNNLTNDGTNAYRQYAGTIGVLLPCGLNFHFFGGKRHFSAPNVQTGKLWLIKAGHIFNFFSVGQTAFAVDYGQAHDLFGARTGVPITTGSATLETEKYQMRSIGATLVQNFDKLSTQAYLSWRTHRLSTNSVSTSVVGERIRPNYQPVSYVMLGAKVSF